MPITPQQMQQAQALQRAAAQDALAEVRLIAGPGTGKSFTIEERVCWLLRNNINPRRIFVISFTNASAQDLKIRVTQFCQREGRDASFVSVTTMHSLALRVLRSAGLLERFPSAPMVLDQWEIENIFDAEFRHSHGVGASRSREIRRDHEAFWSTGAINPPNYVPPDPAITPAERDALETFLLQFNQVYSCILPGAIVRECVDQINAGLVAPVELLRIHHLIVDEYQDLNPMDLDFIDAMIQGGATTFVAGDDDQSIYSFRFALPRGIQTFANRYPNCGDHNLRHCFRCTTEVLNAANSLVRAFPSANRIPKNIESVYARSNPPVAGTVLRWIYQNGAEEGRGIASSCRGLINAGISPSEILILLSDRNLLESTISNALAAANVPFESRAEAVYLLTDDGRILYDVLRVVCNPEDYVAHRSLLGLLPGVGVGTCVSIREKVLVNNLNYRDLFYANLPSGVFSGRESGAIRRIAGICARLVNWTEQDTIADRAAELITITGEFGETIQASVTDLLHTNPGTLTISEFRELLGSASDEVRVRLLTEGYQRLGVEPPASVTPTSRVRVMTMHGAKGLSARVVFVPGLEEEVFPGPRRRPYAGLIEEASRLLYVSITRARAACLLSFARGRVVHGRFNAHAPSRFNRSTGGPFAHQAGGLTPTLCARIAADCVLL